jgi:HEAT repeat protein
MRKNPATIPKIGQTLKDPNADVRASAAWALGETGGKEALAMLSGLTKDENNFVRISAEKALLKASQLKFI